MAEALFRHALVAESKLLSTLKVTSAGVAAADGVPVSENAVRAMERVDLDITKHKSRTLNKEIVEKSYAIFCMTYSHIAIIEALFENSVEHLFLMREHRAIEKGIKQELSSTEENDDRVISDPYGSPLSHYIACRDSMVSAIPAIIKWLKKNYK